MRLKRSVLKNCRIYGMLKKAKRHTSFHTPGHKIGKWDLTELSFTDNLSSPSGVLLQAERDIAKELGAFYSFLLVDGSTCGVLSMIYASGAKRILIARDSHQSAYHAAELMGISLKIVDNDHIGSVGLPLTLAQIEENLSEDIEAVFVTYPDYYGNLCDLRGIKLLCERRGVPLLVDGAHGGMFKGTALHAGNFADIWVDGIHKNLPCLTQGATVSCHENFFERLKRAVSVFRTTSPNYLLMASVEYAVKYPRNIEIEEYAEAFKERNAAYRSGDWSKAVFSFGKRAAEAEKYFEEKGIYPEFCDGENIMFYFSPATKKREIDRLEKILKICRKRFPFSFDPAERENTDKAERKNQSETGKEREKIPLLNSVGRICAQTCGLFPPCIPLVQEGEIVTECAKDRLLKAYHTYGLTVVKGEKDEKEILYIEVYKE